MWQEYTRETPARPFLAILGTGLALAAASGLAWLVTDARALPATEAVESLADWPITFTLPAGAPWTRLDDTVNGDVSWDGREGHVSYIERGADHAGAGLVVSFTILPQGSTAAEAMFQLTRHKARSGESIRMGPLAGTMIGFRGSGGLVGMAAAACSEKGLAIAVEYATLQRDSRARLAFQEVCRSIKFKDWSIRPRTDEFILPK